MRLSERGLHFTDNKFHIKRNEPHRKMMRPFCTDIGKNIRIIGNKRNAPLPLGAPFPDRLPQTPNIQWRHQFQLPSSHWCDRLGGQWHLSREKSQGRDNCKMNGKMLNRLHTIPSKIKRPRNLKNSRYLRYPISSTHCCASRGWARSESATYATPLTRSFTRTPVPLVNERQKTRPMHV